MPQNIVLMFHLLSCAFTVVLDVSPPGIEMEIVNSCEKNNGGCSHHCEHTTNGPLCSCNHGYQLDRDRKTCVGKNCTLLSLLSFISMHFPTLCFCRPGHLLKPALYHCVPSSDSDECVSGESCCSHFCRNYPGGYECSCRAGHGLNPDGCGCDGKSATLLAVYLEWCFLAFPMFWHSCAHLPTDCSAEIKLFKAFSEQKTRNRTFCSLGSKLRTVYSNCQMGRWLEEVKSNKAHLSLICATCHPNVVIITI